VAGEPVPDLRGLVGALVVADDVHVQAVRDVLVDLPQGFEELLVAVAPVQLADDSAVGDVEGGEQAGDALAGRSGRTPEPRRDALTDLGQDLVAHHLLVAAGQRDLRYLPGNVWLPLPRG
jgi:hypothetical protein